MATTPTDWRFVQQRDDALRTPAFRQAREITGSPPTAARRRKASGTPTAFGRSIYAWIVLGLITTTTLFALFDMWLLASHARP
jgi:hypothetical protein